MTETGSLAFHALAPDGSESVVLLLERDGPGSLRVTEWPSAGFAEPGLAGRTTADEVARRVEAWRSAGWRFSESPVRIRAWLQRA